MPFDYGFRLNNRQRIANPREKPIEANKNQSLDGAEGLFLRRGSPQNVYLLPQRPNFSLERCPRPKQIYHHPNNEPDKISHPATASPDSLLTASQIRFATGKAGKSRQESGTPLARCSREAPTRIFSGARNCWRCRGSRRRGRADVTPSGRAEAKSLWLGRGKRCCPRPKP